MNTQKHSITDSTLNQLLEGTEFLNIPDGFETQVMLAIDALPETPVSKVNSPWWQWAALLSAGIPGAAQLLAFIFSAWQLSSVG